MSPRPPPPPLQKTYTYIVEHLDPELGSWSALEYRAIARESRLSSSSSSSSPSSAAANSSARFVLSSLPATFVVPDELAKEGGEAFKAERRGVEEMYPLGVAEEGKGEQEIAEERVCLLDPAAERDLGPEDGARFGVFLFGGILGDDPPRDRTSELRKKGYEGRRLGPVQMTTDTAVRVVRMVVQEGYTLDTIPYLDHPELKFNEHESTQMPFRYVKGKHGLPVMPEGMLELIKKDADKSIDDLF